MKKLIAFIFLKFGKTKIIFIFSLQLSLIMIFEDTIIKQDGLKLCIIYFLLNTNNSFLHKYILQNKIPAAQ